MHNISRDFGVDFDEVVDFSEDTHRVKFDRPVMFPDVIGGHCLIPNTELLLKNYDSEFLSFRTNERRKAQIRDGDVRSELKKVKARRLLRF